MTTRTTTRSTGYDRRPAAGRRPAQRVPHLEHLELSALREYRQDLLTEESRVSYWRRILQARLDNAVGRNDDERTTTPKLQSVLSQHQESSRRLAVHTVHDGAGVPPLPDLTVLWESGAGNAADGADDGMVVRLAAAEVELSAYRRALHERLDDATSELIARYREKPALALCALPLPNASDVA